MGISRTGSNTATGGQVVVVFTDPGIDVSGQILFNDTNTGSEGIFFYDTVRAKWLDISLFQINLGTDTADNAYMEFAGIASSGALTGFHIGIDFTIVGVSMRARRFAAGATASKDFNIHNNGISISGPHTLTGLVGDNPAFFHDMTPATFNLDVSAVVDPNINIFWDSVGAAVLDCVTTIWCRRKPIIVLP